MKLRLQALLSWLFMRPAAPLQYLFLRCFFQIRAHDRTNLDGIRRRPVLVVANHLSMMDSWIVAVGLKPRWIRNFKWFPWNMPEKLNFWDRWWMKAIFYIHRCIPVERGSRESREQAVENGRALLRRGNCLLIFPEGTRSRTGKLRGKLKMGAALMAMAVDDCVVLPIYHRGTEEALPIGAAKMRRGTRLDIYIGKPIEPQDYPGPIALTEAIRQQLQAMEDRALVSRALRASLGKEKAA